MADKGKKVSIKLPDGTIGDIPEENVQEALKRGAQLADTAPPPARGLAGALSAIARKAEGFEVGPYIEKTKSVIKPVAEFLSGAVSSAMQQPVGMTRLVGVEPSSIKVPEPVSRAARGAMAFGLGPAFGLAETTAQALKPPKQPGLGETTVSEMVKAPESGAGRVGEFAMDVASFAVPYTAATKLPAVASFIGKAPRLAVAADLLASNALSSMQEYAKTGNWDKALDSAGFGMLTDIGLRGLGKTVKKSAPAVANILNKWALPLHTKLDQTGKAIEKYHQELADRMFETASSFTRKGLDEIENRFTTIVSGMKKASRDADELLSDFFKMKLIGPQDLKIVDFKTPFNHDITDLLADTKGEEAKKTLISKYNDLIKDMPSGKMTFEQAELEKERLNKTLASLYDSAKSLPDIEMAKQLRVKLNDAIRRAQRKSFSDLKYAFEDLKSKGHIPDGSPADVNRAWEINIPESKTPIDYAQAQKLSMKDADILGAGWGARLRMVPQSQYSYYNPMSSAIALNQFMNASLFTPSQVATLFRWFQEPITTTKTSSALRRAFTTPSVTGKPPSVGRAVTRGVGASSEEPTTEPLPSSLAPQPELPKGTDYWGSPLSR